MLCENDPKCWSYNFHILTKNCEMNDETKDTKPNDFVKDNQRFYMKREDIDECKGVPFICDVNANCQNTDGSYICTCKAGYTGNGKTCTDIDECSTRKHNCSHVAVCNNTIGSYNCTCKEGYVGDEQNCSDIDECLTGKHNCSHVAVCDNTIGSYNCTCKEGYVGDGQNCSDINECSTGKHNCSNVAECNNTKGSYNCTCNEGYAGDGRNCSDIDECSTGKHNCSNVAVCNNTIGSYNCTCKEAYVVDGRNCSTSGCPKDWVPNDKYCYKLASDRLDRFYELNDARKNCKEMTGDLPIIKSEQENTFLAGLMQSTLTRRVWLGIKRDGKGKLLWFDGISVEKTNSKRYSAWANGEPNGKNCAYVYMDLRFSNVAKWYAGQCDYHFPFASPFLLCQKSRL
ncbi:protein kinase C-binding protein NELL2-like isoform X2 [Montipora capricornis]